MSLLKMNYIGLFILSILASSVGLGSVRLPAAIPADVIALKKPTDVKLSPELIASFNYVKSIEKPFDPAQIVPLDIQPTTDSGLVFNRVADQSLSSLFNSAEMRSTPIGQTATQVEKKMKQEITMTTNEIQHKVTFQVQAFQGTAKIDYKGYTNASIKYVANASSLGLEVWEKLSRTRDVVLGHLMKPDDRVSSVNMRWNF